MAKILYEVKQNLNQYSLAYGKWFARVKALETLNTRKLANHISEHGSIYTPDVAPPTWSMACWRNSAAVS